MSLPDTLARGRIHTSKALALGQSEIKVTTTVLPVGKDSVCSRTLPDSVKEAIVRFAPQLFDRLRRIQVKEVAEGDVLRHPKAYINAVMDAALLGEAEAIARHPDSPEDIRTFIDNFLSVDPLFTSNPVGLAALQFEAWLIKNESPLYMKLVETIAEPGKPDFISVFEGAIVDSDWQKVVEDTADFVTLERIVNAGDTAAAEHERSDVTIVQGLPVTDEAKKNDTVSSPNNVVGPHFNSWDVPGKVLTGVNSAGSPGPGRPTGSVGAYSQFDTWIDPNDAPTMLGGSYESVNAGNAPLDERAPWRGVDLHLPLEHYPNVTPEEVQKHADKFGGKVTRHAHDSEYHHFSIETPNKRGLRLVHALHKAYPKAMIDNQTTHHEGPYFGSMRLDRDQGGDARTNALKLKFHRQPTVEGDQGGQAPGMAQARAEADVVDALGRKAKELANQAGGSFTGRIFWSPAEQKCAWVQRADGQSPTFTAGNALVGGDEYLPKGWQDHDWTMPDFFNGWKEITRAVKRFGNTPSSSPDTTGQFAFSSPPTPTSESTGEYDAAYDEYAKARKHWNGIDQMYGKDHPKHKEASGKLNAAMEKLRQLQLQKKVKEEDEIPYDVQQFAASILDYLSSLGIAARVTVVKSDDGGNESRFIPASADESKYLSVNKDGNHLHVHARLDENTLVPVNFHDLNKGIPTSQQLFPEHAVKALMQPVNEDPQSDQARGMALQLRQTLGSVERARDNVNALKETARTQQEKDYYDQVLSILSGMEGQDISAGGVDTPANGSPLETSSAAIPGFHNGFEGWAQETPISLTSLYGNWGIWQDPSNKERVFFAFGGDEQNDQRRLIRVTEPLVEVKQQILNVIGALEEQYGGRDKGVHGMLSQLARDTKFAEQREDITEQKEKFSDIVSSWIFLDEAKFFRGALNENSTLTPLQHATAIVKDFMRSHGEYRSKREIMEHLHANNHRMRMQVSRSTVNRVVHRLHNEGTLQKKNGKYQWHTGQPGSQRSHAQVQHDWETLNPPRRTNGRGYNEYVNERGLSRVSSMAAMGRLRNRGKRRNKKAILHQRRHHLQTSRTRLGESNALLPTDTPDPQAYQRLKEEVGDVSSDTMSISEEVKALLPRSEDRRGGHFNRALFLVVESVVDRRSEWDDRRKELVFHECLYQLGKESDAENQKERSRAMAENAGQNAAQEVVTPAQIVETYAKGSAAKMVSDGVEDGELEPIRKSYHQYIKRGNSYEPVGEIKLEDKLARCPYNLSMGMTGPVFTRFKPSSDEAYRFPNFVMEEVIEEVQKFWGLAENSAKLGIMHNRGVLLFGPPGNV